MYCPSCGQKIEIKNSNYCSYCGFSLQQLKKDETIKNEANSEDGFENEKNNTEEQKTFLPESQVDYARNEAIKSLVKEGVDINPQLIDQRVKELSELNSNKSLETEETLVGDEKVQALTDNHTTEKYTKNVDEKVIKPQRKIGWGWYILLGLLYLGISKNYKGEYAGLLDLLAIAVSIPVYFLLRNKYLKRIQNSLLRAFLSGAIAYVIAILVVALASPLINSYENSNLVEQINKENKQLKTYLLNFNKEYQSIELNFIKEPTTKKDIQNNFTYTQKLVILIHQKDSMVIGALQRIKTLIENSSKASLTLRDGYAYSSSDFSSLIDKAKELSRANEVLLNSLLKYYNAILSSEKKSDLLWNNYENEQKHIQSITYEFGVLYKKVFGIDIYNPNIEK